MCFDYAPSLKWWCCRKVQFFLETPPILLWSNSTIPIAMYHSTIVLRLILQKRISERNQHFNSKHSFLRSKRELFHMATEKINYKGQDDKHWKKSFWKLFDVYAMLEFPYEKNWPFWQWLMQCFTMYTSNSLRLGYCIFIF